MRSRGSRTLAGVACLLLALISLAGCGGGGDGGTASRPAPPASNFPSAKGKTLAQVLNQASGGGPVVSPAARVLRQGSDQRFPFGVFTAGREAIDDAKVAIYAAPGPNPNGPAEGPYPARIEDLATKAAFEARTTANDPDAAKVVYVSQIDLNRPGTWSFGALIRQDDGTYKASLLATPSLVGEFDPVGVGDRAPRVHTPTANEVSNISQIDTRIPPDDMHSDDLADVLGEEPVVLLFATPQLCQSRICGPVTDVAEQVKQEFGDKAAFIHMEVYNDNQISEGVRPQLRAYRLPSEPWLYVIDRHGIVRTAIEGAFSVEELDNAVREVTT